ncbi:hypothetical protein ACFQZX_18345 [Mucilaginibacter litoreus]|uniref:Uncharacterized protein n=1 Tax=Mucilaginibacter litoreus TaxID=1048221 RepID=A0ABW3AX50_9SPHI
MKTIRFNFNHPVHGNATLTPVNCIGNSCQRLKVNSTTDNELEVPVTDCNAGKWRLTLDWEHEGRMFTHQEDFEIKE